MYLCNIVTIGLMSCADRQASGVASRGHGEILLNVICGDCDDGLLDMVDNLLLGSVRQQSIKIFKMSEHLEWGNRA